ncbi:hypothetical protein CQ014_21590 [Pseudomonas lurida]|nr:hypothetical protein CLM75_08510 [Pseudomonas lurida]PRA15347.1 hypothetical protein CQ002_17830 [Pseudomonas sp. MYb13]PRA19237.1 hypothetical protein CQ004_21615 [Pseudomonas lurida]PRA31604.1 hypothetical protein CQ005_21230 [Pseudomonas lurida]PRB97672.1 hypothetical protein CQ014_21590 [Pseudomonas lurida]
MAGLQSGQKAPKRFKPRLRALNWPHRSHPSSEGVNRFSAAINAIGPCREGFSASFSYLG